jgi:hypothetical protein
MPTTKQYATFLLILAFAISHGALAKADDDTGIQYRYTVSSGPSVVFPVSGESKRTSSMGADFMYRFSPKWEVGVQVDFNFLKSFDGFEGYSVALVVAYSVTDRLNTFMGAGVEHRKESGENELLVRLGGEYSIFLDKKQRFMLLPGSFIDFVGGDSFVSVVLAVGYTF